MYFVFYVVSLLINFPLFRQSVGVGIKIALTLLTELTDEQSELEETGCQTLLLKLEPADLDQG